MATTTQTDIVVINVTQTIAASANILQQICAAVSTGGTNTPANTVSILTQASDLTPLLEGALAVTSATWLAGTVTLTTTAPHGLPTGDTFEYTAAGFAPAAYNGTFDMTVTGANTLTYPLVSDPGTMTTAGAITDADVAELVAMVTTWFAQGSANPLRVLELGNVATGVAGVAALSAYVTANPLTIYSYLVPLAFYADVTTATDMAQLCRDNASLTSMVYFVMQPANDPTIYNLFKGIKSAIGMVPSSADYANGAFDASTFAYNTVVARPSASNKVPPFAYRYALGVTSANLDGPTKILLKQANMNFIDTGAEGGISNTLMKWGTTADGRPFNYWYAVDWIQINLKLNLANEIINGSNNQINPLYYNQPGIKRLQTRAQAVLNSGVAFGLIQGSPVVDAQSFADYTTENPNDYAAGIYNGLSAVVTPQMGFVSIIFNLNVTDFASA